jgi:hypothetical protein
MRAQSPELSKRSMQTKEPVEQGLSRRSQPIRAAVGHASTWWDSLFGSSENISGSASMPAGSMPASIRFQTTPSGTRTPRSNDSESPALSPCAPTSGFVTTVSNSCRVPASEGIKSSSSLPDGSGGPLSVVSQVSSYLRRRSIPEPPAAQEVPKEVLPEDTGVWQVIWRENDSHGTLQTLSFEGSSGTRAKIQSQVLCCLALPSLTHTWQMLHITWTGVPRYRYRSQRKHIKQ